MATGGAVRAATNAERCTRRDGDQCRKDSPQAVTRRQRPLSFCCGVWSLFASHKRQRWQP